jgi:DNA-binding MarR family transcriptional regulator
VLPLHQGGTRTEALVHPPTPRTVGVLGGPCAAVAVRSPTGHDGRMPDQDEVDRIVAAWGRQRDDLDFAPLQVLSRVDRLARHLDRARRAAFDASGMEPWEFDVLSALRRAGDPFELSPKTLLQQTLVSSGTMTNRVDRLAARGLVARRTDPKDGRGILVSLTDAGRAAVDSAIADLLQAERDILTVVSTSEQDQLAGLLRRVILGLGD